MHYKKKGIMTAQKAQSTAWKVNAASRRFLPCARGISSLYERSGKANARHLESLARLQKVLGGL